MVRLWDAAAGAEQHAFGHLKSTARSACFTPDGSTIVVASLDGTATLFDLSRPEAYERFIDRAVSEDPRVTARNKEAAALVRRGAWYALRGADDLAVELLQQAVQLDAGQPRLTLARSLWRLGRLAEAREEFRRALETNEAPKYYLDLCLQACGEPAPSTRPTG